MIVFRLYDLLGGVVLKVETHTHCCSTGSCCQEDGHAYEHATPADVAWQGLAESVGVLVHRHLSELGDEAVLDAMRTTRVERRTSL